MCIVLYGLSDARGWLFSTLRAAIAAAVDVARQSLVIHAGHTSYILVHSLVNPVPGSNATTPHHQMCVFARHAPATVWDLLQSDSRRQRIFGKTAESPEKRAHRARNTLLGKLLMICTAYGVPVDERGHPLSVAPEIRR